MYNGRVTKITRSDQSICWHFSDNKGRTLFSAVEYILYLETALQYQPQTVETHAFSVAAWHRYIQCTKSEFKVISHEIIVDFRNYLFNNKADPSSNSKSKRQRSINVVLRAVYKYLDWIIRSDWILHEKQQAGTFVSPELLINSIRKNRYPAAYRNIGEASRHSVGWTPERFHRTTLVEYFYRKMAPSAAERNSLILDIALNTGWRLSSILSLKTTQFNIENIDFEKDTHMVTPESQKFGYTKSFEIPTDLMLRIVSYLDGPREDIVIATRSSSKLIFLSIITGNSLNRQSVSAIFSIARRELGWPRGGGIHSWRRAFTTELIERELDSRIEQGLDLSLESVSMTIAAALGHESLDSHMAYVRDTQRRTRNSIAYKTSREVASLHEEIARLTAELERQRQKEK
jgi:integrase